MVASEDPLMQVNNYNEFYTSVGRTTAAKTQILTEKFGFINNENTCDYNCDGTLNVCDKEKFSFMPVTESEVLKIVKAMPSNKAPGTDKVTTRVMKTSLPVTLPIITKLDQSLFSLKYICRIVEISGGDTFSQR